MTYKAMACIRRNTTVFGLFAALLLAAAAQAQTPPATPADCDMPGFARTLVAPAMGSAKTNSQAVWLDRTRLHWPAAPSTGSHYRLLHSSSAALQVQTGQAAQGAEHAVPLRQDGAGRFTLAPEDGALGPELLRGQLLLVSESADGRVQAATGVQFARALDDLYAAAATLPDLGVRLLNAPQARTQWRLWAPTAARVAHCLHENADSPASELLPLTRDDTTGVWQAVLPGRRAGLYYTYLVDVYVNGSGWVRNRVTDPYSLSLSANSRRSWVADLEDPALAPAGWTEHKTAQRVRHATDMVIYELHVRDFSINDTSVPAAHRGKYLAFADTQGRGRQHLRALSRAGLTDVHLLPVFDIATIDEVGCTSPQVPQAAPDSEAQQAAVTAQAGRDCFNWGYDPFHFNAPEGSYATDAADAAVRVREFRTMVQALHQEGLRVGMDVVYNHTTASGQHEKSVLDRIVPGYYHRLNAQGEVERSTCCDNTATEHRMMGRLLIDSVVLWARHYGIDSFRFDLMGHQPKSVMQALQVRLRSELPREVQLIGEGWNFGEVADGARFEQAAQGRLNGTGIGTFSDRGRDAIRGGSAADGGAALVRNQGYINGLVYDPNGQTDKPFTPDDLLRSADLVRVGLAGSLRDYVMTNAAGQRVPLHQIGYAGQGAGYVSEPSEVVNYVENHDNQTLFDINAYRLPHQTSHEDRVRVQILAVALNALSQGVAYFHAGVDTLRSKSLDGNSFDSGDWFNRIDWRYRDNYFGTGLPAATDNRANYGWMKPLLGNARIKPRAQDIALARDLFREWLQIRASTPLLRLPRAADIASRLRFCNTGATQNPVLQVAHIDGRGYQGARFSELLYVVNVDKRAHSITLPEEAGKRYRLHPVQQLSRDLRLAHGSRYHPSSGRFEVPARSAAVFVAR